MITALHTYDDIISWKYGIYYAVIIITFITFE